MDSLENIDRLVIKAKLKPISGNRFQPTGFPDLGAAEIPLNDGTVSLLVESPQSMAKRLSLVCLNYDKTDFVNELKGLSIIKVNYKDKDKDKDKEIPNITNSVLEGHRIASSYILESDSIKSDSKIKERLVKLEKGFTNGVDLKETAKLLFELDVNSLIHGVWASHIESGRIKVPRVISSFIEAEDASNAISGGVKTDHVDPSGDSGKGLGSIPFSRIEYTAKSITLYFNVDLEQIRSYGLGKDKEDLLTTLSMWKIRRFLEKGLRLRTACDLNIEGEPEIVTPSDYELPDMSSLNSKIRDLIKATESSMEKTTVITKIKIKK